MILDFLVSEGRQTLLPLHCIAGLVFTEDTRLLATLGAGVDLHQSSGGQGQALLRSEPGILNLIRNRLVSLELWGSRIGIFWGEILEIFLLFWRILGNNRYLHASLNHDMIRSIRVNRRVSSEVSIPVVGVPGDPIDVSSGVPEVQLDVDSWELTTGDGKVEL